MSDFNPDEFLAETQPAVNDSGSFDPDGFLRDTEPATSSRLETLTKVATDKPDQAAKYNGLAKKAGVTYEVAKLQADEIEKQYSVPDWREFSSKAPKTASHLAGDPVAFQVLKNDVSLLGEIEQSRKPIDTTIDASKKSFQNLPVSMTRSLVGGVAAVDTMAHQLGRPDNANATYVQNYKEQSDRMLDMILAEPDGAFKQSMLNRWFPDGLPHANGVISRSMASDQIGLKLAQHDYDNSQSSQDYKSRQQVALDMIDYQSDKLNKNKVVANSYTLPWLASSLIDMGAQVGSAAMAGLVAGPVGAAVGFAAPVVGSSFADAKQAGMDDGRALENTAVKTAAEVIPEMFGLAEINKAIKATSPMFQRVVNASIANAGEEAVTTILNQVYDAARDGKRPDIPQSLAKLDVPEKLKVSLALLDQQLQDAIIGGFGGAGIAATGAGAKAGYNAYIARLDKKRTEKTEKVNADHASLLGEVHKVESMQATHLDKDVVGNALHAIDGDNERTVFVDPSQLLNQEGLSRQQVEQLLPSSVSQLDQALSVGGLVSVPRNELIAHLAATKDLDNESIIRHFKEDATSDSKFEIEQAGIDSQIKQADMLIAKSADAEKLTTQRSEVYQQALDDLNKSGMFKGGNDKRASVWAAMATATAMRTGKTPMEMYKESFGRVTDQAAVGDVLNQQSIQSVKDEIAALGVDAQISELGDIINLDKISVPEDSRNQGKATAAMRKLLDYADASGKHIALSPSTDFGANKKRLKEFYRRFGFVENKGENKAFSTRETMHRQAAGKLLFQDRNNQAKPRGTYDPSTRNINLTHNADLSTFLHESGHMFLDIMVDMSLTENASESLKKDMDATMRWFGIEGDTPEMRLYNWSGMSINEKRQFHEKWAESFEQYLFEGKAPSIELAHVFSTFRQWLLHVYKSIAQFISSHDGAKLNDEVRGVFDRMLATEQQIQEAEAARGLLPLFDKKPDNMTDAEWKAMQQAAEDSARSAFDQMTARSLRDMKWLSNAKNKTLRKLQREADAQRRESRMEARQQIMSQGIYRAWQFLNAPVEGSKAANKKAKASAEVDASRDSLLTAIAKLGGLNMEQAVGQYGIDSKDFHHKSGVFSKPVLRKEGGLSPDAMCEALSQYGYMPLDDNGKWDIQELEDKLRAEAAGDPQYSTGADYDLLLGNDYAAAPDREQIDFMGGRISRQAFREMYDDVDLQNILQTQQQDTTGMLMQPAYHGTPYKFDKFSLEHMGKGEGAQAYGWGLYFAGNEAVAEYYRGALAGKNAKTTEGVMDSIDLANAIREKAYQINPDIPAGMSSAMKSKAAELAQDIIYKNKTAGQIVDETNKSNFARYYAPIAEAVKELNPVRDSGQLYKVEIPEDDTYLLWDRPFSEQPEQIQKSLKDMLENFSGKPSHRDVVKALIDYDANGGAIYGALDSGFGREAGDLQGKEMASKELHANGIGGIKYLDGTSRSAGEGNYNYVIFDDGAIKILETFYQKNGDKDQAGKRTLEGMGILSDEGLHPDTVADLFGLSSGDELIRKLMTLPDPVAEIERLTDEIMLQRHAYLATQESRERAAEAAIHNEAHVKFLATELTALNRLIGKPRLVMAAAKEYANNIVVGTKIKDMKPGQYVAAEAKAGKAAEKAFASGNIQDAALQKRNQVLHAMTVNAVEGAKEDIEKAKKFFAKIAMASNKKNVTRGRDPDVVNAINAIIGQYGFYPSKGNSALEYLKIVEQNDPEMFAHLEPAVMRAMTDGKSWRDMTHGEFMGFRESIDGLWYLAKRSREIEIKGNRISLEEAAGALHGRMVEIGIPDSMPGEKGALTSKELIQRKLQAAGSLLRRVEQWAEAKDGKYGGAFLRYIFQPVKIAADNYRHDKVKYRKAFSELLKSLPAMKRQAIEAPELGYTFGAGELKVGLAELLHAVLHTGNESNKRKLLLGRGWAREREDGSLDTGRWDSFLLRMVKEGKLTKEHFSFAQGVWDLLEETKPLAQKTHREVFGHYFAEVTANQFGIQFPDGETITYRGGYVPAQTDTRIVNDAAVRALADQENQNMSFAFPSTSKGFTKSRVEYNKPLLLDIRSLTQHMDKVLLFSHMESPVRDVAKLLKRADVSEALYRIDPTAVDGMLQPWLARSARQAVETPILGDGSISKILSVVRSRAGMALMMGNISNTIQQVTGFSSALTKVKARHIRAGVAAYLSDPKGLTESVASASVFMRDRIENEVSELSEQINEILIDPTLYQKGKAWTQKHAYFLQSALDNTMGPMIWTGAYNQSIGEGFSHDDAVQFANSVIRQTQGTTLPEDISRIETGPAYGRAFTQFIGYFNMLANTNATELKKIQSEIGLKNSRALGVVFFGVLAPAWIAEAIALAFKGGPDDPDDDGYIDDWLSQVIGMGLLKNLIAGVPFVGTFLNVAINNMNKNPSDDRASISPAIGILESGAAAMSLPYHLAAGDNVSAKKAVTDVASLVTVATGLPARPLARPLGYLAGMAQDKINPTGGTDFARGMATGAASPESKTK